MEKSVAKKKRVGWLDYGKGILILSVVLVHTIGSLYKTGQFPAAAMELEMSQRVLFMFVMPVFFAISGYLFKPSTDWRQYITGLGKKLVMLGVPYVVFSVVYVILQNLSSSTVHDRYAIGDLLYIGIKPVGYLWYLYVYFFILVLFGALTLVIKRKTVLLVVYTVLFALAILGFLPTLYAINQTVLWGATFLVGYLLRSKLQRGQMAVLGVVSLGLIIALWILQGASTWFYDTNFITPANFMIKLLTIPVFFAIFMWLGEMTDKVSNVVRYFGKISLVIYLIHPPVVSIARIVVMKVLGNNLLIDLVLVFMVAMAVSLFGEWLSKKLKLVAFIFYPTRFYAK